MTEGVDIEFLIPGKIVSKPGTKSNFGPPGSGCGAAAPVSGGSGSVSSSSPAAVAFPSSTVATAQGGIYATVPVSSTAETHVLVASSSPVAAAPIATSTAASAASPTAAPAVQTPGSAYSTEGEWNYIGRTLFQLCASGILVYSAANDGRHNLHSRPIRCH